MKNTAQKHSKKGYKKALFTAFLLFITSTFVLTIVIVIIVSKDSKTTNISPNNDSNSKNNTDFMA